MKKKILFRLAIFLISFEVASQPYGGTIFVDSDIVTSSDSSTLVGVTYTGQGIKTIFDRRVNNWITVNAFLFDVAWNDELSSVAGVNPEFTSVDLAMVEAEKYGWSIGQLPHCLRIDVDEIWINKGVELFGGGNNSILIHTGQTILYENDGILEETLVHEGSHTSLDAMHAGSSGWLQAQNLDGGFISDYAEEFPNREDIAESFLMWLAVRYRKDKISTVDFNLITEAIPNRLDYFDDIACDLFPFLLDNPTSLNESEQENHILVYPNPTQDFIQLQLGDMNNCNVSIYNIIGEIMLNRNVRDNQKIDLSQFPNGVYYVEFIENGKLISEKILKL